MPKLTCQHLFVLVDAGVPSWRGIFTEDELVGVFRSLVSFFRAFTSLSLDNHLVVIISDAEKK